MSTDREHAREVWVAAEVLNEKIALASSHGLTTHIDTLVLDSESGSTQLAVCVRLTKAVAP